MTTRVAYLGRTDSPEFATLRSRKNVELVGAYDPDEGRAVQIARETGVTSHSSIEAFLADARIDAVVLDLAAADQVRATIAAAERGVHVFLVPPIAPSHGDGQRALEAVARAGIITSVGWPMRYAINLIQIRHHARRSGVRWMLGRVVAGDASGEDLLHRTAGVCDLLRYVGGPIEGVRAVEWTGATSFQARFDLASGVVAHLLAVSGARAPAAEETSIELLTARDRMAWYFGTNHTVINGTEQRVAEKVEGLYVAEIAAFITAIETGWRSPILCDYAEGLGTVALTDHLRRAGEELG